MSEKIQTEFAKNVLAKAEKISKSDLDQRPSHCTAPKMCKFLATDSMEFVCIGIWKSKDEDIIRLCVSNAFRQKFWMWMTPHETLAFASSLIHGAYYCMATGIPDLSEVLTNFGEHTRKKMEKEANR